MYKIRILRLTSGWVAVILTAVLFIFCFLFTLQFDENSAYADKIFYEIFCAACLGALIATAAFFLLFVERTTDKGMVAV